MRYLSVVPTPKRKKPVSRPKTRRPFRSDRDDRLDQEHEEDGVVSSDDARTPRRQQAVIDAFSGLWSDLFSSPVHLDSALAKQSPKIKSILAQIVTPLLLRPVSTAEVVGVGIAPGEPWELDPKALARWRGARDMAERLYEALPRGGIKAASSLEDFPPRIVEEWKAAWGEEAARELAHALGSEAPLILRARRTLGAEALMKELSQGGKLGVKSELSELSPLAVRLSGYAPVLGSEAFERGDFEIQDEGSQVMAWFTLWPEVFAPLLSDRPGAPAKAGSAGLRKLPSDPLPAWTVVDACAGAGGKTLAFADAMGGKGRIFSYDISDKKLQALRRRAKRAGFNNVQAVTLKEGQEAQVVGKFRHRADVVLVDAPCSGWGVLRRNPDIKWRQDPASLERMPKIQERLLHEYSELVAPGGRLVFGVCTFRPAETVAIVESFLKSHPDFTAGPGGYLGPSTSDGFFMQAFQRKAKDKR